MAVLILIAYGLNSSTGMVVYNSLMQTQVPEWVRGRVYTLMDLTWSLMRLVSLGIGVLMVDTIGVQAVYYAGGTLLTASGIIGLLLLGGYRFEEPSESHSQS